ncbi:CpaE family protein [Kytococcus sedentarius]|uniref:AAA family ATPase n=1 Tax=Kytococcus sedentarius TaxID=1276 RepID=UPI0035BC11E9
MSADLLLAVEPEWDPALAATLSQVPGARVVRRCADVADLLGVAEAGIGEVAVVSGGLRDMDFECVEALRSVGIPVVGVHAEGDEAAQRRLAQWGVAVLAPYSATVHEWGEHLTRATTAPEEPAGGATPWTPDPQDADPDGGAGTYEPPVPSGAVVAVWGPPGAPGRSTVALELAAGLAAEQEVLLVDGDTHAPGLAQHLALLDDASGLVAAARAADEGRLDVAALAAAARTVRPGLRVLTGIGRADRWPEVRAGAVERVLDNARRLAALTVVDLHATLEDDEVLSYDTRAPRRNALALTVLARADLVVVVGGADAIALQRLVRGLDSLEAVVPGTPQVLVLNRARRSAAREAELRETAERHLARGVDVVVPEDRATVDRAVLVGEPVVWTAPRSTVARRLARAGELVVDRVPR